ncbi:MAG: hypothetical protein ACREUV_01850 [Burkholderiales bacterium]
MDRRQMIQQILEFSTAAAREQPVPLWAARHLRKGIMGLNQLSNRSLERELQMLGLVQFDGEDEFDYAPEHEAELMAQFSSMIDAPRAASFE